MKKRMNLQFWIAIILFIVGIANGAAYIFGEKNLGNLIVAMTLFILSHLAIIHGEITR